MVQSSVVVAEVLQFAEGSAMQMEGPVLALEASVRSGVAEPVCPCDAEQVS